MVDPRSWPASFILSAAARVQRQTPLLAAMRETGSSHALNCTDGLIAMIGLLCHEMEGSPFVQQHEHAFDGMVRALDRWLGAIKHARYLQAGNRPLMLTMQQISQLSGIPIRTLRRHTANRPRPQKTGRRQLFEFYSVKAWLDADFQNRHRFPYAAEEAMERLSVRVA